MLRMYARMAFLVAATVASYSFCLALSIFESNAFLVIFFFSNLNPRTLSSIF